MSNKKNTAYANQHLRLKIQPLSEFKSEFLFNLFYKLFDVVHANTSTLIEEAYRIRYQVFCHEHHGYERPEDHTDQMEKDSFDPYAEHALLLYKPTNTFIGTVRVIKPRSDNWERSFPLQDLCESPYLHTEIYAKNSCEFSRLCISRKLRDEASKNLQSHTKLLNHDKEFSVYEKPLANIAFSIAPLGLIRGAFELTLKQNILNVFAVMEPYHLEKLKCSGLVYDQIGPEINYHGRRIPFRCNILETYDHAFMHHYDAWNIVSVKGKNHEQAKAAHAKKFSTYLTS